MNTVSLNILIHRFLKIHETFVSNRYLGVELLVTFELLEPQTLPQMWLKMTFLTTFAVACGVPRVP